MAEIPTICRRLPRKYEIGHTTCTGCVCDGQRLSCISFDYRSANDYNGNTKKKKPNISTINSSKPRRRGRDWKYVEREMVLYIFFFVETVHANVFPVCKRGFFLGGGFFFTVILLFFSRSLLSPLPRPIPKDKDVQRITFYDSDRGNRAIVQNTKSLRR